jgi:hypothetical protein
MGGCANGETEVVKDTNSFANRLDRALSLVARRAIVARAFCQRHPGVILLTRLKMQQRQ